MIETLLEEIKKARRGIIVVSDNKVKYFLNASIVENDLENMSFEDFLAKATDIQDADIFCSEIDEGREAVIIIGTYKKTAYECEQIAEMLKDPYDGSYDNVISSIIGIPFHYQKGQFTNSLEIMIERLIDGLPTESVNELINTASKNISFANDDRLKKNITKKGIAPAIKSVIVRLKDNITKKGVTPAKNNITKKGITPANKSVIVRLAAKDELFAFELGVNVGKMFSKYQTDLYLNAVTQLSNKFKFFEKGIGYGIAISINKPGMKYRSRTEIVGIIIEAALTGATKTKILYKAYLSYPQLNEYLEFLQGNNLIKYEESTQLYRATEKGRHFLHAYDEKSDTISSKPSGKQVKL